MGATLGIQYPDGHVEGRHGNNAENRAELERVARLEGRGGVVVEFDIDATAQEDPEDELVVSGGRLLPRPGGRRVRRIAAAMLRLVDARVRRQMIATIIQQGTEPGGAVEWTTLRDRVDAEIVEARAALQALLAT